MEDIGFELLASSLRAETGDLKVFVEALATKLEGALPGQTRVERKSSGLLSRSKHVRHISVDMGDLRYELSADDGRVETSRCKCVRGVVLKRDRVPLDEWIDDLSRQLSEEATRNEQARLALQRLLGA